MKPNDTATITETSLDLHVETHDGLDVWVGKHPDRRARVNFPHGTFTTLEKAEFGHLLDAARSLPPSLCERWGIPRSAALRDAEAEKGEAEQVLETLEANRGKVDSIVYHGRDPGRHYWQVIDFEEDGLVERGTGPTFVEAIRAAFPRVETVGDDCPEDPGDGVADYNSDVEALNERLDREDPR